ncbi:MAG TPA: oligopeptide:H+ symporter [Chlamydiales bacterium]|nr:oligopeptide:H+ symporter [Chlamydiales bacterium]
MDHAVRKGRIALLFMQMFSTLGFSVLYSTLVLYATQGLHLGDIYATAITGAFIAFNYSLHVLGGYVGGRLLSYRGLFVIGMALQAAGCLILSMPNVLGLIWGVAVFLSGCGLNVVCINCMLTQLFDPHDKRRESAFLWNYSGMNLGFFIGFSVSGIFQLNQDFHMLFLLSSLGSLISFVLAFLNWKYLADKGTHYSHCHDRKRRTLYSALIVVGLIIALSWLISHSLIANALICFGAVLVACLFAYIAWKQETVESSRKVWAFLLLAISSTIFWTLYQMAPMGLTLFFNRNVDHTLLGMEIPPQWLQNINTVIIILGGPLMASLNQKLRTKGYKITIPFQFTTALFLIGIGYLILPLGIHFADPKGFSNIVWVVGCYAFQSVGELFISPIGYAMIGQLIPSKLQGFAMGAWLMVTGVAAILSSYFSQSALGSTDSQDPLITNITYSAAFLELGIAALIGGVILYFLRKFLHRLIQEKPTLKAVEPAPYNAPQD